MGSADVDQESHPGDEAGSPLRSDAEHDGISALSLMDRVNQQLSVSQNFPDPDEASVFDSEDEGHGGGGSVDDVDDDEGELGGGGDPSAQEQSHQQPLNFDHDAAFHGEGEPLPFLADLHRTAPSYADSSILEGGAENLRYNTKAAGSPYYPFATKEQQLLWVWQHVHQISRQALEGLLELLLMVDQGSGFDVRALEGVNAEHFSNRMRHYLPLLEVVKRTVPSKHEGVSSEVVYDVPVNILIDRDMRLSSETALSETYPSGKILRGDEAVENSLMSDHVNCVPTVLANKARKSNMNGTLARTSPFMGIDGIRSSECGRKIYIHDVCICEIDSRPMACRLLELYWDTQSGGVLASVRRFREAREVLNVGAAQKREGLVRVWEDCTAGNQMQLEPSHVLGLAEIYTADEVDAEQHREEWEQGARCASWPSFVGEGFVQQSRKKRRRAGDDATRELFEVTRATWDKEGTPEDPLFVLRRDGFHLNEANRVFYSAPIILYNDAFNSFGMGNKHSVGGSYFGWAWRNQAVQRMKRQTHVGTLASGGACCQGEIGLQCEIIGLLQRGCLGHCTLTDSDGGSFVQEVFVRGSLLMLCGDGQGRAKLLGNKHPNSFSKFCCPYCMVEQRDDDSGGDLGNARYDVDANQRTWGQIKKGFAELESLSDQPGEQTRRSQELGLLAPDSTGLPLPLYTSMDIVPTKVVPVERLHFDALGSSQLCQVFCLELLSTQGRRLVSAVMAQRRSLLYPPGTEPLKDIVTNYSSLTGSDKWTLQSIMQLVFRPVLQDIQAMKNNMKRREISDMKDIWGTDEKVLDVLQKLVQVASHLSFAVRAPSHNDLELQQLDLLARDVVGFFSNVMGRTGSRPTIHSILHIPQAIREHGIVPDASSGEFAHQQNKSGNKSDCGRDPPMHYIKRANTNAALLALSNGLEYHVRKYNRSTKEHEIVRASPGPGCVRVMRSLGHTLGHDRVPTDPHETSIPTVAQLRGQFQGSAIWSATLFTENDVQNVDGSWDVRLSSGCFRPDEPTLIRGYRRYFGCGGSAPCDNIRCPFCWDEGDTLENSHIDCSRYMAVARAASCGSGRLRGGDAKAAAIAGPRDDWALGQGQGDDVEIFKDPQPTDDHGSPSADQLTMSKIVYFFQHKGNTRTLGGKPRPSTWWVLAYDFVGVGDGNDRVPDSITGHPTLLLRGRGRPAVYPVAAIRRQVHMYHQCPRRCEAGPGESYTCGEAQGTCSHGRDRIWRHKFRLALPGSSNGYDRYLLNEVHHSVNQDTFV